MKLAGFLLLLAGWVIVLAAVVLLVPGLPLVLESPQGQVPELALPLYRRRFCHDQNC